MRMLQLHAAVADGKPGGDAGPRRTDGKHRQQQVLLGNRKIHEPHYSRWIVVTEAEQMRCNYTDTDIFRIMATQLHLPDNQRGEGRLRYQTWMQNPSDSHNQHTELFHAALFPIRRCQ